MATSHLPLPSTIGHRIFSKESAAEAKQEPFGYRSGEDCELLSKERRRYKTAIVMRQMHSAYVYPPDEVVKAAGLADILNPNGPLDPERWPEVEVVLGGWGMPILDSAFLEKAKSLQAVFYAAGSVRCFMTDAAWERKILVTSATDANSATTAEFCTGEIIFSLKHGWRFIRDARESWRNAYNYQDIPGLYGSRVGLVGFGKVARRVASLLQPLPVEVAVWDPIQPPAVLAEYGAFPLGLEELVSTSHVVSVHAPLLPATRGLVSRDLLRQLRPGATLVNTSRGEIVDEAALVELLAERPDLTAVLDVTAGEPPKQDSPLFDLPNVILTPHIAGCYGPECRRLGALAIAELSRFVAGQPPLHPLTREAAELMA